MTEPTLRHGDESADGWVEYLQQAINYQFTSEVVAVDGNFGPRTHDYVVLFQQRHGLMADGVVGDQTWAALRNEAPQPPGTDGEAPHTFVEHGPEARWLTEAHERQVYDLGTDSLFLTAYSLGDVPVPTSAEAKVRITDPAGTVHDLAVTLSHVGGTPPLLLVVIGDFAATYGTGTYTIEASLPDDLGGDQHYETLEIH